MSVVLVAIVILTGYIFANRYPQARFRQLRAKGWSDYGHLLSYGTLFCAVSGVIVITADYLNLPSRIIEFSLGMSIEQFLTATHTNFTQVQFILWATISLTSSLLLGKILETKTNFQKAREQLSKENEFEHILYTSSKDQKVIQISLKSSKVYIGIVNQISNIQNLDNTEYFTIFPLYSGYRDKDKQYIHLTNSYSKFYDDVSKGSANPQESSEKWVDLQTNFKTLIMSSEVISLAFFNFDAYKKINRSPTKSERTSLRKSYR